MPYRLPDGRTVTPEMPFTLGEDDALIQYPPNFLKYTTEEERAAMGITWEDPEPETPAPPPAPVVPQIVSDRQFFQQLAVLGVITADEALAAVGPGTIPAALSTMIDALPEGERFPARMLLTGATQFDRGHPLVDVFATSFGWSHAQTDQFWRSASAL